MSECAKTILEPGVYPGMSMADYFKVDAVSSHTLHWADVSMQHFKAALDGRLEREDTTAFAFGRALHTKLLEPDEFDARVTIRKPCQAILTSGKRKGETCGNSGTLLGPEGEWRCGQHDVAGAHAVEDSISEVERIQIDRCVDAVKGHKAVKALRREGQCEVVLVAEINGVLVKGRLDKLIRSPAIVLDVKKVAAAKSPGQARGCLDAFARTIRPFGYDVQLGIYRWLVEQALNISPQFWWLVVEDDEPHSVGVYRAGEATVKAGTNRAMALLGRVAECRSSGIWNGYTQDVVEIDMPTYQLKEWGQ